MLPLLTKIRAFRESLMLGNWSSKQEIASASKLAELRKALDVRNYWKIDVFSIFKCKRCIIPQWTGYTKGF